jgi:hypothetical protein
MMAGRERQTAVADLRLSVYLRALHPEFFDIRARRDFEGLAFDGQMWLIEGGARSGSGASPAPGESGW